MIKILLIVIGLVLIIWFLLPVLSGRIINIGNTTGVAVGLVLLLYGLFFDSVNHFIAWFWQRLPGKIIEIIVGLCILAVIVLAVMTMVAMGTGMRTAANAGQQDGYTEKNEASKTVIILGCRIRDDRPSLMLSERLEAGLKYLNEHPRSMVIVSGGQGEDEITAESEVMYNWLIEKGVSPERIIKEDRSTDTHENLANCREIIAEGATGLGTDVVIVTNEFHEYRALKIAKSVGLSAEPWPAATAWWLFPTYYVREMYGILEDWFLVK